jgi:hypothetical protein
MLGDPRSRQNNPHRMHNMGAMNNDPRSHGGIIPRYADNYERHKRTISREAQESMGPNDYQRQRHMDQFGQDNSNMGPPMHGIPNSAPGDKINYMFACTFVYFYP